MNRKPHPAGHCWRHGLALLGAAFTLLTNVRAAVTPPDPSWVNKTFASPNAIYSSITLGADETLYFGTTGSQVLALDKYIQHAQVDFHHGWRGVELRCRKFGEHPPVYRR